jgi:hypothetical protein
MGFVPTPLHSTPLNFLVAGKEEEEEEERREKSSFIY